MKTVKDWVQRYVAGTPGTPQENGAQPNVSPTPAAPSQQPRPAQQGQRPQQPRPQQGQRQPQGQRPPQQGQQRPQNAPLISVPDAKRGGLKLYPLGGFEQVGRNCFVIEVDGDIYIIDLGLQFPDEDMLGIDYLIPDLTSLRGRENRIKAVLFTHGHLDHIGAVQHVISQLHFPPMYGTKLTMAFVKKRLDEEGLSSKVKSNVVAYGQKVVFGKVQVEFLRVTHSIPDSAAIAVHTPYGTILHTGDFSST
jgi:ribonuclease J